MKVWLLCSKEGFASLLFVNTFNNQRALHGGGPQLQCSQGFRLSSGFLVGASAVHDNDLRT